MSWKKKFNFGENVRWPVAPGNYIVGYPNSSVAICTLGTKIDVDASFAIKGRCMTENLGIEKVIVNIISNLNIRFLLLCGSEVAGHYTGECFKALHKYGVNPDSRRIIKAPGPIPIIGNIPLKAVERFRSQVDIVDLIGVMEPAKIKRAVFNCVENNPGAYPSYPFIVKFERELVRPTLTSYDVSVLPEYRIGLDPFTSLVGIDYKIKGVECSSSSNHTD